MRSDPLHPVTGAGAADRVGIGAQLNVTVDTLERWRDRGLVQGARANDKGEWLYYLPTTSLPAKWKRKPVVAQLTPETSNGGAV